MVEFKFIEYGTDFGTRDMGQKLREKLLPLINGDEKVVLDFTGVNVVSNSFADECIAKLLLEMPLAELGHALSGTVLRKYSAKSLQLSDIFPTFAPVILKQRFISKQLNGIMKHFFSTILPTMLLCMFGAKAYAYDIAVKNADDVTIYYNFINDDKELEVTYLQDYDDYAFDFNWNGFDDVYVGNVVIPEEVTYSDVTRKVTKIGDRAFGMCIKLTSVTIPNGVTAIGSSAFAWCSNLTSVTIPNSVTTIGSDAFDHCVALTSVTIPNSVKTIGRSAFGSCESLTSVTIPESMTSIGDLVFSYCESLTSVTIPNSVTSIGEGAFEYCESLLSVVIPDGVTFIGNHAFWECSSLTSITIPNSVTTIEFGAFYHCSALTSITIPDGVTSIGSNTFSGCSSLTSITIPNGVTSLGDAAFSSCTGLTSITIPSTVTSMGRAVFANMDLEYVVSQIEDPFAFDDDSFFPMFSSSTYEKAILYVPAGTIDKYKATIGWNKFAHIEEGSPTGMKASERKGANELKRYDLSGRTVKNSSRGVNIIRMDDGTTKKVVVK